MTTAPPDWGRRTALPRVAHRVIIATLVLSQLVQQPGRQTFDTKLDLVVDPASLLASAVHLWNPLLSFGELQNQAYGYLFPLGSFFALGDAVGLPPWLVQRFWSALVLVAAFEGARRLLRAVSPASAPGLWLIAGLAYALAPRTVGLVGVLSAEALPAAVLPWVVLPLVHAVSGRWTPARAAGLSGLAFLMVGGINATAAVAILPLPALVVLLGRGPGSRLRLAAWWSAAVLAASAWWVLPLLVLGRYSPPFLDVIETARATTGPLGWSNVARGLDDWLFFAVVDGGPWWAGAAQLASSPVLVAATAAVAALGFVGLLHRGMPARLPLAAGALVGVALMVLGHDAGVLASPLAGATRDLLDGVLAPLRNVHKLDPGVRLPLALGLAHLVGVLVARRSTRARPAGGVRRRVGPRARPLLAGAVVTTVVALLVTSAWPLVAGTARQAGWTEVPVEWRQAATYLGDHADDGRTWVLPGSGFGRQTWGRTVDEPIQPLARAAWVTRSQVPLVPQQTMRYLDALEARVSDGRGSPALADALARAGIGHVLLRHDLGAGVTTAPSVQRVGAALRNSRGLTLVQSFDDDDGRSRLDVYRVERHVDAVDLTPVQDVTRVTGAPDDVIALLEGGVIAADRPTELVPTGAADVDAVGDAFQRRERQFGRTYDAVGPLLGADEAYRQERAVHDYAGPEGVEQVTATSSSGARATASSSSGYTDSVGPVRPELGPAAAVDGSLETMWRSSPLTEPVGQWLEVRLPAPRPVEHVDVRAAVDGFTGTPVRRVTVTAGDQSVEQQLDPESGFARVRLTGAPVSSVRVTVSAVRGGAPTGVVALREVSVPGVDAVQQAELPGAVTPGTDIHFRADRGRRACTGANETLRCDPELARVGDEYTGLRRVFRTTEPGTWSPSGTVVARAGAATLELLDPPGDAATVRASTVLADDPLVAPAFAHDGDPTTWWSSAVGDPAPSLTVGWEDERTVSGVRIRLADAPTRVPRTALVTVGGRVLPVTVTGDDMVPLPSVRARELKVTFPVEATDTEALRRPLAVAELEIDGVQDLAYRPDPTSATGAPCGLGPAATIDGRRVETEVRGTLADVLAGTPLEVLACSEPQVLPSGEHRLVVPSTDRFAVTSATLTAPAPTGTTVGERSLSVEDWQDTRRVVAVGVGGESVLRVAENANPGWRATLDGQALESLVVDGWQQGYRVPAGAGGRVVIEFAPDRVYRAGLATGAALALLLLVATLVAVGRGRRRPAPDVVEPRWARMPDRATTRAALVVGSAVVGGLPLATGALAGSVLRTRPRARLVAAGGCVAAGGLVTAISLAAGQGYVSGPADLVAGVGVGLLLAALPTPADTDIPDDEESP
ncbi:MAG TPA: alpha-(1-_3)-arabinofuranosyltransferase family protein [Ornithinibacter sp.]|nr:alpha-(1->3)-arabinofuranosyltransferase family protein [Ornithinibacter sp.]